jgi:hypothetical protein
VETQSVTEATPQFRNIYVDGVVANGAAKAIFVRGLPEMNVKNIVMQNMTIEAAEGLDMTEGTSITLRNVHLLVSRTNPVLNIHNSRDITLERVTYNKDAELLLNVSGEKSKGIRLNGTDTKAARKGVEFTYGATEAALGMR